jgi:hypothetical protein
MRPRGSLQKLLFESPTSRKITMPYNHSHTNDCILPRLHFTSRAHPDSAQPPFGQNESLSLYLTHPPHDSSHQTIRTIGRHGPDDAWEFHSAAASHRECVSQRCMVACRCIVGALNYFRRCVHEGVGRMRQGGGLDVLAIGQNMTRKVDFMKWIGMLNQ